jgi:hypothetical protein
MSLRYRATSILRNGRRDWLLGRGAARVMRLHSAGGDERASAGLRAGGLRAEEACRRRGRYREGPAAGENRLAAGLFAWPRGVASDTSAGEERPVGG